ncbi:MAG: hypothetical protein ABW106_10040 [Steroidobacteraceae bacterium]
MRSNFLLPAAGNSWSSDQIRTLRKLAGEGLPAKQIAMAMKRTESAIRNKAGMHGISLKGASNSPPELDVQPA